MLNKKGLWLYASPNNTHVASLEAEIASLPLSVSPSLSLPLSLAPSLLTPSLSLSVHLFFLCFWWWAPFRLEISFISSWCAGFMLMVLLLVCFSHLFSRLHSPLENEFQCSWPFQSSPFASQLKSPSLRSYTNFYTTLRGLAALIYFSY